MQGFRETGNGSRDSNDSRDSNGSKGSKDSKGSKHSNDSNDSNGSKDSWGVLRHTQGKAGAPPMAYHSRRRGSPTSPYWVMQVENLHYAGFPRHEIPVPPTK